MIKLTLPELRRCAEAPGILRALADQHDVYETEADASDMPHSAEYHKKRAAELRTEAELIEREWEA